MQGLVIEASRNEFLIEILERLHSQVMRFWRIERIDEPDLRKEVRQLRQVVAAVKCRDGRRSGKLIQDIIFEFHRAQMAEI
jgi:DNA-binding GntR family transcriptional regulator